MLQALERGPRHPRTRVFASLEFASGAALRAKVISATHPTQRLNANTPAFKSTATREIPRAAGLISPSTSS
jgi:hypothetical protein